MTDSALKWANKSRDVIEGMLAPYGGPIAGKDLDGEFFSANTDFSLEWFGDWQRPMLYHHGKDETLKSSVVGRIKVEQTDQGLWMQGQLDKAHEYYDAIADLVDHKALGLSSGSVAHLVATDHKTGEIKTWPLIEGSLTPTPANPDAKAGYAVKAAVAIEHLTVIGVEAPDAVKSEASDDAASATYTVAGLIALLGEEEDEAQAGRLRAAIEAINAYVAVEVAEIGTPEDAAETAGAAMGYLSMKSLTDTLTPQSLHDAAIASGAKCASETPDPEPPPLLAIAGKSVEPETAFDLDALVAQMTPAASRAAVAAARELTG